MPGKYPEKNPGAGRTDFPLRVKGTGRAYTELIKQYMPGKYPEKNPGAGRTDFPLRVRGTGRAYTELIIRKGRLRLWVNIS